MGFAAFFSYLKSDDLVSDQCFSRIAVYLAPNSPLCATGGPPIILTSSQGLTRLTKLVAQDNLTNLVKTRFTWKQTDEQPQSFTVRTQNRSKFPAALQPQSLYNDRHGTPA